MCCVELTVAEVHVELVDAVYVKDSELLLFSTQAIEPEPMAQLDTQTEALQAVFDENRVLPALHVYSQSNTVYSHLYKHSLQFYGVAIAHAVRSNKARTGAHGPNTPKNTDICHPTPCSQRIVHACLLNRTRDL